MIISLLYEVNQRVEWQLSIIPPQATAGRTRNAVLPCVCLWGQDCFFQAAMILVKTQCPSSCSTMRLCFIFL